MNDEARYQAECKRLCQLDEVKRVLSKNPELGADFLGFLEDYQLIAKLIPEDMPVVDLGCNSAIQAEYFTDRSYIGVDTIPIERRLQRTSCGSEIGHLCMSIQDYCEEIQRQTRERSEMICEDVFAMCCNVPDNEKNRVWDLVSSTFQYYCITYPGLDMKIRLPL